MRFSKRVWLAISGITWVGVGVMLLVKGLRFIVGAMEEGPLLHWLTRFAGAKEQAALLLISVALLIGLIKGRTALARTVKRITARIVAGEGRLSVEQVYDTKYYVILGVMVGIGIGFRFLPIPLDVRGGIDVTIGSALMNGGLLYLKQIITCGSCSRG